MRKTDIPVGTMFQLTCGEVVEVVEFKSCSNIKVVTESGEILSTNSSQLYSGKIRGYKNKITHRKYEHLVVGYTYSIQDITYKIIEVLSSNYVVVQRECGGTFISSKNSIVNGKATGKNSGLIATDKYLLENNKWIEGYEGQYSVSMEGKIYSYKTLPPVEMAAARPFNKQRNEYMYPLVNLSLNGVLNCKAIHRLVAETFLPKEEGKVYVNHIDGDKSNNRVENLEWCTASENTQHALETGLLKTGRKIGTKYDSQILETIQRGYHLLDKYKLDKLRLEEEVLLRLGIDPVYFFNLPLTKGKLRASKLPVELIISLLETKSLTEIAKEYNYSLSAVSRKLERYSKLKINKNKSC